MLHGRTIVVVLPAYYAAATLERTYNECRATSSIGCSWSTMPAMTKPCALARRLGIETFVHARNLGYGGIKRPATAKHSGAGADIVVMVHPDYQYTPALVTGMASMIATGLYDVVARLAHPREAARSGGMPRYKYVANRVAHGVQKPHARLQTVRVSHRLPRLRAQGAGRRCRWWRTRTISSSTTRCLAQVIACGFAVGEIPVSDEVLSGGELDQLQAVGGVRSRRGPDEPRVPALAPGIRSTEHLLRLADTSPKTGLLRQR